MDDHQSLRILLLEDDPADARLVQENLRDSLPGPFTCACVSSVSELFDQLRAAEFDVLLLDLGLPDSPGLETFLKVRALAPQLPVLILTGLDDQTLGIEAVKQGAQDYIVKGSVGASPLARAIRYSIERHRLQNELYSLSLNDSLTGLYNRRGFLILAGEQLKLLPRSSHGLLLFLCDLDGMKPINDTFGHAEGDRALLDMAGILRATFRSSDLLARLGGDEFVGLAVGTLPHTAELLQARLQVNLNQHKARSDRPYVLSFSIGMAYIGAGDEASLEALISRADKEMYAAKRARQVHRS